jgi:hypothetical protein
MINEVAMRRVWVYDREYRREYRRRFSLDVPAKLVVQTARRFGGFKGLLPCRELVTEAADPDHHLFGLCFYPRELQRELSTPPLP